MQNENFECWVEVPGTDGRFMVSHRGRLKAFGKKRRVSPESLDRQLTLAGCDDRRELPFHKMLLAGELPLTMGGGIGQSRLCMLLLGKAHIGEVQSSIWDETTHRVFSEAGITLL